MGKPELMCEYVSPKFEAYKNSKRWRNERHPPVKRKRVKCPVCGRRMWGFITSCDDGCCLFYLVPPHKKKKWWKKGKRNVKSNRRGEQDNGGFSAPQRRPPRHCEG